MLSYARLLLGGQAARRSGYWRQLRCSLLLFLVLTSCRGEMAAVQDQGTIQQDCMLNWLLSLNISRHYADTYYRGFSAQFLDQRNLNLVSDGNLRELGVQALGHRFLILDSANSGMGEMCRNDGSCNYDMTMETYSCSCGDGFQGNTCETATSGCRDNPCKNGGTCSEGPGSTISCSCPPGYHGDLCQYCTKCSSLKIKLETLKEASQATNLQIFDTIRRSTGLRFFKPWMEIDHYRAIFIRHFTVGSRHFIGMVIENAHHINGGLVIYEIFDSERLSHIQTLGNSSTSSFKVFENDGKVQMIVGNYYEPGRLAPPDVSSKLYTWNENTSRFHMTGDVRVYGVRDVDHMKLPNNDSFLALSVHDDTRTYDLPTFIYRYMSSEGRFYYYRQLRTTAARRVNFFTFNSTLYLFVAERVNTDNSHHTNSSVYRWNSTDFVLLQEIETIGAFDLLPFSIGDCFFVVAVNNRHNHSYNVQSKVYLMIDGVFKFFASLDTRGATKADFFRIGLESFLVFSNSHDDGSVITNSVVYRFEGGTFVIHQEILTQNAMYVHFFTLENGSPALAFANKAGKPALYKWKSLSYSCPEGNCQ